VGEVVTWDPESPGADPELEIIANTLDRPNSVGVGASDRRLRAAKAGVLEPAVDAAHSARASNSLEKMLCHQMAGAHFEAMPLLELGRNDRLQPGDLAKYTNAAARLMDIYQGACLALQKLKTTGRQHVIVQYQQVNVSEGGQAVVTGTVDGGSRRRSRGRKRNG
jgi:hypothetical protein